MTTIVEGKRSLFLGAQAFLIENDREMASSWASQHVVHNDAHSWILGRFVEADRANSNKQLFSLDGLQMARPTISHAPMNMNHAAQRIVGSYVATDLIYPVDGSAEDMASALMALYEKGQISKQMLLGEEPLPEEVEKAQVSDAGLNPYIEALGVFWKHYFPRDFEAVEAAHAEGRLYYSMECIPQQIQCTGKAGCGQTFEYAGRLSETYCNHLNDHISDKYLIKPHFTAGAILIPPVRPGWAHADVHSLVAKHCELAEDIYEGIAHDLSHLDPRDWEMLMGELLALVTA